MVLAVDVNHSSQAVKIQKEVTDMANELLRKNAEVLRIATIETAKKSERGTVDTEALETTNQPPVTTLDKVMKIQIEGRGKRRATEQGLAHMGGELK